MSQFKSDVRRLETQNINRKEVMMLDEHITPSASLVDAFGRLRTSDPVTLFDSQNIHTEGNKFATKITGGATKTYLANESSVALNVTAASGDEIISQSKRVMPYQPGKSLLILNTFVMNIPKAGLRQRVGYFDDKNGVFLENDGTTNYLVLRSYVSGVVSERKIPQDKWNFDKFDGTGLSSQQADRQKPSSQGLDVSKSNIFWIDVEWLGVGDVRCGFVVGGIPRPAHIFHNDNENTSTYMSTACLPVRYEITNTTATSGSSTLKKICSSVISEGGFELKGVLEGCGRGFTIALADTLAVAGTEYPLIAVRLKTGRNNSVVIPNKFHMYVDSNATVSYRIWIVNDVTGGTWETRNTDTPVEFNVGVTGATYTDMRLVGGGFVTAGGTIQSGLGLENLNYQLQYHVDGTRPCLLLTAIPTNNNIKVLSKAEWMQLV